MNDCGNYIIELNDLTTGYKAKKSEKVISPHINAKMSHGELICLLGQNGAGKSTLLKTITGFLPPLKGNVILRGKGIAEYTILQKARLISLVSTEKIHFTGMTAYEVVAMGRSPYTGFWGRMSAKDRKLVEESLRQVGMEAFATRHVETLSDGERQKILIAKAIAQETPIIVLDEPTAFLDYPSKVKMMLLLKRLAHNLSKTVFISTHDLRQALLLADRLWLLDRDKGFACGTPDSLSSDGEINRYFDSEEMVYEPGEKQFRIKS